MSPKKIDFFRKSKDSEDSPIDFLYWHTTAIATIPSDAHCRPNIDQLGDRDYVIRKGVWRKCLVFPKRILRSFRFRKRE